MTTEPCSECFLSPTAAYAGSFDPITYGHWDLIKKAVSAFPKLVIGVGNNPNKNYMFNPGQRKDTILKILDDSEIKNVEVKIFSGLLIEFCKEIGASIIVRGLRTVSDFEFELRNAYVNHNLAVDMGLQVSTHFLITDPENAFISSSMVKELAKFKSDLKRYVHPIVAALMNK